MDTNQTIDESDIDWIIVECSGIKRAEIEIGKELSCDAIKKAEEIMKVRLTGVPLSYCLGYQNFFGRNFFVNRNTLIPRCETEQLVDSILKTIKCGSGLDVGTGSGIIPITLNLENSDLTMTAVDISDEALLVADKNAKNLNANVDLLKSDLFSMLKGKQFDFIVSNPPYIKTQDIETLALLFSSKCSLSRLYMEQYWQDKGKDEESIKQNLFSTSNNIFNITNKKELEHFRDIKELICDTVLTNTSLDDMELTKPINKYLQKFYQLSELDRTKLALLEKYYNIDLKEAEKIVQNFSYDINNLSSDNEYHAGIVEQIKAIKNIFESNDIKTLQQVAGLDILVETDLSVSTFLIEQSREMFEQIYKGSLYEPKQENKIETITFNGKKIDVFDANKEFSMIVKRITVKDDNSQEIWNSMTKEGEYGRNDLRYNTCASYMTDENILELLSDREVILGFGNGTKDYSFDAIYTSDAHTPFYGGDRIYNDLDSTYMLPTTLETNTDNNYNEIVINTLGVDEQGQMTKLQPDYVIYIKGQNKSENMEKDPVWINSKKVASEFGIPIVMVDKEKIKETERTKIANIATTLSEIPNPDVALKFVKKIEHYINRYGIESIQEFVSNDKMKSVEEIHKEIMKIVRINLEK